MNGMCFPDETERAANRLNELDRCEPSGGMDQGRVKTWMWIAVAVWFVTNRARVDRAFNIMIRNAFKMKLKPGCVAEYKRRHDEIWPELAEELKAAGVADYSIFLDEETLTLFAVQKLSANNSAERLPQSPVVRRWWDSMAPLMEVHPDNSPVCGELREVFHLD